MAADLGFILGDGLEHLCDAVAYVVLHQVLYNDQAQEHTHARKQKVRKTASRHNPGEPSLDAVDGQFQQNCRRAAKKACQNRQAQQRRTLRHLTQKAPQRGPEILIRHLRPENTGRYCRPGGFLRSLPGIPVHLLPRPRSLRPLLPPASGLRLQDRPSLR